MLKSIILSVFSCFVLLQVQAQNLYMPRDIQQAFKKETRSPDGRPGKNYWQNHGRYTISITALPPDRNIKGTEQIIYFNNSPDTLKRLNMKLILNIHRPGAARFGNTGVVGMGINVRYYCMITDKFGFFPQMGISSLNNTTYFKYGTLNIGAMPNFVFFPAPQLGVNLGFGNIGYSLDYQTKNHNFNLGLNNNISFGLNYYWGRK